MATQESFFRQLIGAELREVSADTPGAFFNEDVNKYFVLDMPDELADVSFTDARKTKCLWVNKCPLH